MLNSYIVAESTMFAVGVSLEKTLEAQKTHNLLIEVSLEKTSKSKNVHCDNNDDVCNIEFTDTCRFQLERSDVDAMARSIFQNGIGRYASVGLNKRDIAHTLPRISNLIKIPFLKLKSDLGHTGTSSIEIHGREYERSALGDACIFVKSCKLIVAQDDIGIINDALDLNLSRVNDSHYEKLADSYERIQHAKKQVQDLMGKDTRTAKVELGKLLRKLNTWQYEYDELINSKIHAHCYVNLFGYTYHATATP